MLLLTGVELIFFIVSRVGLSFRFVLERVLITQGCFHYCKHSVKAFLAPYTTNEESEGAQGLGAGHSQDR